MKKYIQVHTLTNDSCDLDFGYVAIDIETGEICYFTNFDQYGIYDPNELYLFDPYNISGDLAWHMSCSYYPIAQISNDIHPEIIDFIKWSVNAHRTHNEENGYRTDLLDFNEKHLKVIYVPSYDLFDREDAAFYVPVENRMTFHCDRLEYEDASKRKKNTEKSNVIHEVGHMKVSTFKIDGNKLFIKTGFFPSEATLELITLRNGDIFYKIMEEPKIGINLEKKALEEIINDTDCANIFPTYNRTYPHIGDVLNKLCDGKLPRFREEDDAFLAYFDYLKRVVGSKDLADEINGLIKDALFGRNRRKHEAKALKLIKQCEERKSKN
ncbi:MAG: hypothetical protein K2G03_04450 [Bacilli bacterium]|nr:hypothetical protein [Bacilli bacterium]